MRARPALFHLLKVQHGAYKSNQLTSYIFDTYMYMLLPLQVKNFFSVILIFYMSIKIISRGFIFAGLYFRDFLPIGKNGKLKTREV